VDWRRGAVSCVEELIEVAAHLRTGTPAASGVAAVDGEGALLGCLLDGLPFSFFTTKRHRLFPTVLALALPPPPRPGCGGGSSSGSGSSDSSSRLAAMRRRLSGCHLASYLRETRSAAMPAAERGGGTERRSRGGAERALALCAATELPMDEWEAMAAVLEGGNGACFSDF